MSKYQPGSHPYPYGPGVAIHNWFDSYLYMQLNIYVSNFSLIIYSHLGLRKNAYVMI